MTWPLNGYQDGGVKPQHILQKRLQLFFVHAEPVFFLAEGKAQGEVFFKPVFTFFDNGFFYLQNIYPFLHGVYEKNPEEIRYMWHNDINQDKAGSPSCRIFFKCMRHKKINKQGGKNHRVEPESTGNIWDKRFRYYNGAPYAK